MGLEPNTVPEQNRIVERKSPVSPPAILEALEIFNGRGINATAENCIPLSELHVQVNRGLGGGRAISVVVGPSTITIKGKDSTTTIEGDCTSIRQSHASHPESWPTIGLSPLGERETVRVSLDDEWSSLDLKDRFPNNSVGTFNDRASIGATLAPDAHAFLLINSAQEACSKALPGGEANTYASSRGAKIDLRLVELGVDVTHATPLTISKPNHAELADALLSGSSAILLSKPTLALVGASKVGNLPTLRDGSNVTLQFPDGAQRVVIVGSDLIKAGSNKTASGVTIIIEGNDGTLYTQTRTIEGKLSIRNYDGKLQIVDEIEVDGHFERRPILHADSKALASCANQKEPRGDNVISQVASMLQLDTAREMRVIGLLRLNKVSEGLSAANFAATRFFTNFDTKLHNAGLPRLGDMTAFSGVTPGGSKVTFSSVTIDPKSYQLIIEPTSSIKSTELQDLAKKHSGVIVGVNQEVVMPTSTLPAEIRQAHLIFNDPRNILEFMRSLD